MPRQINLTPMHRLLHLAGPTGSDLLLSTLLDDIKSTQTSLDGAWSGPDYTQLRLHSHVLIALAGTVGDSDLQTNAQLLNTASNDKNKDEIIGMSTVIMVQTAELIDILMLLQRTEGT
jgi:two-component system, OmpR family, aerobic respiration control sensor histidine kinase ArcB